MQLGSLFGPSSTRPARKCRSCLLRRLHRLVKGRGPHGGLRRVNSPLARPSSHSRAQTHKGEAPRAASMESSAFLSFSTLTAKASAPSRPPAAETTSPAAGLAYRPAPETSPSTHGHALSGRRDNSGPGRPACNSGGLVALPTKDPEPGTAHRPAPECLRSLEQHRDRQCQEREAAGTGWKASGYVFTRPDGSPVEGATLKRHFNTCSAGPRSAASASKI